MKTAELFKNKTVLSFEIFPPKPTSDEKVIYETLNALSDLKPDFISVTCGAGGGNNGEKTVRIASDVKNKYGIESVAHLPCLYLTVPEAEEILERLRAEGIENILALRGDIREGVAPCGEFHHADELITFIKKRGDFNVLAACYPEGHTESKDLESDIRYLKKKVDCGADHLVTQLFLSNDFYYDFRDRAAKAGINVPVEAGIMPVTNKAQTERMVKLCGASLPKKFMKMMEKYENNAQALRDAGLAYAIEQIVDLISQGADGIHLYTMNNAYIARRIYEAVHSLID